MRTRHRARRALVAVVALGLVAPTAAVAHIAVEPPFVEARAPTRIAFATPNERPGHATTSLEITAPTGVELGRADAPPGWTIDVTESGARWSGGRIEDESTVSFAVVVTARTRAGPVSFAASQRYDDGEVVRWEARLTVLPASSADSPPEHPRRAVIASVVGLVLIAGSFVALGLLRRRRPAS